VLIVAATVVLLQQAAGAQSFAFSILERYFEQLRQTAGIPGMSAVVVYDGNIAWRHGFGHSDVDSVIAARDDTPYLIGDLTQTFAALMVMQCVERGSLRLDDRVPGTGDVTVRQALAHVTNAFGSDFRYDAARFARLTPTVDACGAESARLRVANDVFDRLAMVDSVPGRDLADRDSAARPSFTAAQLEHYEHALARLAAPYRLDQRRRPIRSDMPPKRLDASIGLVASARDLGNYVAALHDDGLLLDAESIETMWSNRSATGTTRPTGLGWFVQQYNGERLVWHFGLIPDAYSSLILDIPGKKLTLVLLANSDGLSAPFDLAQGDVTRSVFALAFLRLFL
jgi:CubicO group peptidase (beta-lactamase class C family)